MDSRQYELKLLAVLTLANGVVAFDRLAAAFLSPYLVEDLKLSNSQLGLIAGALSLAVAFTSVFGGQIADRSGQRKRLLVICTLVFSIGSAAGGLAAGFGMLLIARFLLGLAEGPMVPISQAAMAETSAPERRGLNMGIMQMVGAFLIGGMAGPIVATRVADATDWRMVFFLSVVPGLILATLIMMVLRPDKRGTENTSARRGSILANVLALLSIPNIRISLGIASLFTAWLVVQNTFLSVYLTHIKGLSPAAMGGVLSMGGIAGVLGGVALPWLSDRIGRKPVCVAACIAGGAAPLAILFLPADPFLLGAAVLLGWLPLGIAPLYCATIPTESVSPELATSAVGLSMGTAELLGGVAAPALAGLAADRFGLASALWICVGLAVMAALTATMLRETAPSIVKGQTENA